MARLPVHWLSNEAQGVLPGVLEKLSETPPLTSAFILAHNGHPIAFTHPHGRSLHWL